MTKLMWFDWLYLSSDGKYTRNSITSEIWLSLKRAPKQAVIDWIKQL